MKYISDIGLTVIALVVGAAIGWLAGVHGDRALDDNASTRLAEKQLNESDRDIHDKADLAALRRRIKDLEREIAAIAAPKVFSKKDYSKMAMRCGDISIDGGLTLADLRKDDPKHYKEIKDWMERHTRNTELTLPAYLAKFDLSRLPGEMKDELVSYLEMCSKFFEMWDRVNLDDDNLTVGELAVLNLKAIDFESEMRRTSREGRAAIKWLEDEKHAREIDGYSDADAASIANALHDLKCATDLPWRWQ